MLTLGGGQERQVRKVAAQHGELPEALLARAIALGLAQVAAESQQGLEPGPGEEEGDEDDSDGYRSPFGAAAGTVLCMVPRRRRS